LRRPTGDGVEPFSSAVLGVMSSAVAHAPPDKQQGKQQDKREDDGTQGRQTGSEERPNISASEWAVNARMALRCRFSR